MSECPPNAQDGKTQAKNQSDRAGTRSWRETDRIAHKVSRQPNPQHKRPRCDASDASPPSMGGGSSVRKKAPVEPAPQAPSVSRGFAERELATVATKRAPPPGPSVVHSEYGYSLLHVTPPGAFDLKQLRQVEEGERGSVGYRLFLQYGGKRISPWHDIPLLARPDDDGTPTYHFLCEIPKGTNAKLEMDKEKELNPITHDLRHGKPRCTLQPRLPSAREAPPDALRRGFLVLRSVSWSRFNTHPTPPRSTLRPPA